MQTQRPPGYILFNLAKPKHLKKTMGLKDAFLDVPRDCFGKWSHRERERQVGPKRSALLFSAVSLALITWWKVPPDLLQDHREKK